MDLKSVSWKAVAIGGLVDVASSIALGIPLAIYVASRLDLAHMAKEQVGPALRAALQGNIGFQLEELSVGLFCSVLGGYVAGRMANHDQPLHGALSSYLCVTMGIYAIAL